MNKKSKSQISEIIEYLRKHRTITSTQAIKKFGTQRLSEIIFVLKERGFGIRTDIAYSKNRYGNNTRYAIYHLEQAIEQDGNVCF